MKCLSSKIAYECRRFKVEEAVYEDQKGVKYVRNHVLTPSAVAILPVTKSGKIILIKEARTAIGNIVSYDLPAGTIEKGEEPLLTAIRELEEETGYVANNIKFLGSYFASKGYTNEKIYLYLADMLDERKSQNLDEGEEITFEEFDYDTVMKMLDNDELNSAPLKICLLKYKEIKKENDAKKQSQLGACEAFEKIKSKFSKEDTTKILKSKNAVVFCVDMINDFTRTSDMRNPLAVSIIPNIKKLLESFEQSGKKIYHICESHTKDSVEFLYYPPHGNANTKGAELVEELKSIKYEHIFGKNSTNGFHNDDVRKWAKENQDVEVVVICGVLIDICVLQFALSLKTYYNEINKNVEIVIPVGCVESYEAPNHNRDLHYFMALELLEQAGVNIVKSVEIK